jgi:ABC-type multidrug transport system ATPase subunit
VTSAARAAREPGEASRPTPPIAFRGVRFGYLGRPSWRSAPPPVFTCEALDVGPGLSLLLGPNGAGKSTFLRLAAGIEQPDAGRVLVAGHDLWREEIAARRPIAYVPEQPDLSPYATIREVVRLVAALRVERDAVEPTAEEALERVGLAELAHRTVRELSMGQRRRALFAAALIGDPTVVLLDEPLETMDRAMRETIVGWLGQRIAAGAAAVVATHELEPFVPLATRAIVVRDGSPRVVEPLQEEPGHRLARLDELARGG